MELINGSSVAAEGEKEERWAEVQKKMTPWRLGVQDQDPELQLVPQQRAARLGKLHSALLVVASLIDKPTNLGGKTEAHIHLFKSNQFYLYRAFYRELSQRLLFIVISVQM